MREMDVPTDSTQVAFDQETGLQEMGGDRQTHSGVRSERGRNKEDSSTDSGPIPMGQQSRILVEEHPKPGQIQTAI